MKNTLIISAYTCCGKTYASEHIKDYDILDVDICKFKTIKRLPIKQQIISADNPDFPNNFIQYIKENIGKVDVVFVDSDIRIRQWLNEAKIKFVTVYPWNSCLPEWIGRMYLQDYPDIIIRNKINGWYHEIYPVKEPYGDQLFRLSCGKYINERLIDDCFILGYGVNGGKQ